MVKGLVVTFALSLFSTLLFLPGLINDFLLRPTPSLCFSLFASLKRTLQLLR